MVFQSTPNLRRATVCRPLIPTLTEEETEADIEEILQKVERNGIMTSEEDALSMIHREYAVVPKNGSDNAFTVDYSVVNSKAFHDKFDGLTEHKAVNESLYKKAAEFLAHRNGTPYENIAMLDSRTGAVLVENTTASGLNKFRCGLTAAQTKALDETGKSFEIVHNHPNSSIPSADDVCGLFNRHKATGSTVFGHNGAVYRMEKLKPFDNINMFVSDTKKRIVAEHPNFDKDQVEYLLAHQVTDYMRRKMYIKFIGR